MFTSNIVVINSLQVLGYITRLTTGQRVVDVSLDRWMAMRMYTVTVQRRTGPVMMY